MRAPSESKTFPTKSDFLDVSLTEVLLVKVEPTAFCFLFQRRLANMEVLSRCIRGQG